MKPVTPLLAVDIVIECKSGEVVLIRRGREPFRGHWALPGGFVELGETVEQAARREALEETGLEVKLMELVGVYSEPHRDPRQHTVSIVFRAVPIAGQPKADDDAADIMLTKDASSMELAFDHGKILKDALRRRA